VATTDRCRVKIYKVLMLNFLKISHTKNNKNRLMFDRVIQKIKSWDRFFWDTVYIIAYTEAIVSRHYIAYIKHTEYN